MVLTRSGRKKGLSLYSQLNTMESEENYVVVKIIDAVTAASSEWNLVWIHHERAIRTYYILYRMLCASGGPRPFRTGSRLRFTTFWYEPMMTIVRLLGFEKIQFGEETIDVLPVPKPCETFLQVKRCGDHSVSLRFYPAITQYYPTTCMEEMLGLCLGSPTLRRLECTTFRLIT